MKRSILFTLLALIFVNCSVYAKKQKPPTWLNNPKTAYPEQKYLSAIGEADSRSSAENMAAANLARIFESRVKTDQTFSQRYKELNKDGKISFEDESLALQNVNISADQTLMNIEFGESYTDELGRVFVIAYLDRFKTGKIYEQRINDNTQKIMNYLKMADESFDLLSDYAALSAATAFSLHNEILIEQLGIIFPSGKELLELPYNHIDLMKQASETAQQIGFKVDIKNDADNKISILISELMNDLGFVISDNYLLLAKGNVLLEETDLKREEKFVRYELQLQVEDLAGNIILTLAEKGREGHISYSEARERAVRAIEKKIKKELNNKIISYFDNMVLKK